MMNLGLQYPIFGPEIQCPHCRQTVVALTLTDTYLCPRHGAFEANPNTGELIHLQSGVATGEDGMANGIGNILILTAFGLKFTKRWISCILKAIEQQE